MGLLALFLVPFVPMASADPEVLPVSAAAVFVDGDSDYFWMPSFNVPVSQSQNCTVPTQYYWEITAPNGQQLTIYLTGSKSGPSHVPLDGELTFPCANRHFTVGNLHGAPADGTWTIRSSGPFVYGYEDTPNLQGFPDPELHIGGKSIIAGFGAGEIQTWNWHQTTGQWVEPTSSPVHRTECTSVGLVINGPECHEQTADTPNDGPQEDPNLARYFSAEAETPPAPGAAIPWSVSTVGADAPDCTTEPWQFNAYGSWSGGDFNTSIATRYYTVSGDQSGGTGSLADIPGAVSSGDEAQGTASPGADTTTLLPYDNVLGTSYQFNGTRNGTTDHGAILYAPPGQCDEFEGLPDPEGPTTDTDATVYLRYYPQDNNDMWLQGTSKRVCDETTTDVTIEGNFNVTFPDGSWILLPPGHDGCFALPFTQTGYYNVVWTHDHPGIGGGTEEHDAYWHVHAGVVKPLSITAWPAVSMDGLVIENVTIGSDFSISVPGIEDKFPFLGTVLSVFSAFLGLYVWARSTDPSIKVFGSLWVLGSGVMLLELLGQYLFVILLGFPVVFLGAYLLIRTGIDHMSIPSEP